MSINAVVADDHQVIRLGVSRLLEGSEIKIVGEATTGQQAVTMTHKSKPDVLLLDVRLPDGDGLPLSSESLGARYTKIADEEVTRTINSIPVPNVERRTHSRTHSAPHSLGKSGSRV